MKSAVIAILGWLCLCAFAAGNPSNVLNENIIYGQSLGAGLCGTNICTIVDSSAAYPGTALMFQASSPYGVRVAVDNADPTQTMVAVTGLTGLFEQNQGSGSNEDAETIAAGWSFSLNDAQSYTTLISHHAVGAQCYTALAKGTVPYNNILTAVKQALRYANGEPSSCAPSQSSTENATQHWKRRTPTTQGSMPTTLEYGKPISRPTFKR